MDSSYSLRRFRVSGIGEPAAYLTPNLPAHCRAGLIVTDGLRQLPVLACLGNCREAQGSGHQRAEEVFKQLFMQSPCNRVRMHPEKTCGLCTRTVQMAGAGKWKGRLRSTGLEGQKRGSLTVAPGDHLTPNCSRRQVLWSMPSLSLHASRAFWFSSQRFGSVAAAQSGAGIFCCTHWRKAGPAWPLHS